MKLSTIAPSTEKAAAWAIGASEHEQLRKLHHRPWRLRQRARGPHSQRIKVHVPLDSGALSTIEAAHAFWRNLAEDRGTDWLVTMPTVVAEIATSSCEQWAGARLAHVGMGVHVLSSTNVQVEIERLRSLPASLRFLLIDDLSRDLGDLDLTGLGWVVVRAPLCSANADWLLSIRLQCLGHAVPLWVERGAGQTWQADEVREEPRWTRR